MVECAFRKPERMPVRLTRRAHVVVTGHIDHVREDRARVGLEIAMAPAQFVGQEGAHTAGIDDVCGMVTHVLVRDNLHPVGQNLHILDRRVLQYGGAVGDGYGGKKGVGVLPVDVNFVAVGQFGDHRLQALLRLLLLPWRMVQKAEVTFDAMLRADIVVVILGTVVGHLRHIVIFGQRPHHFRRFEDHRLADGEARVGAGLEHDDAQSLARQHRRQRRAADAAADNGDVIFGCCMIHESSCPQSRNGHFFAVVWCAA